MTPSPAMINLSATPAIVLAGGFGTRLRAAVSDRPKVLADVAGRPFLAHLLDQLRCAGIRRAVLCTGYLAEQIEAAFGARYHEMELAYSCEREPLGTGGAIAQAARLCPDAEHVLAMNGDSYCAADLGAFFRSHLQRRARASLLLTEVPDTSRYGKVTLDARGQIRRFDEKTGTTGPGLINAGIYAIQRPLLQMIPQRGAVSMEREMFPLWIGHGLFGHPTASRFIDIGTPESYALAEAFLNREAA